MAEILEEIGAFLWAILLCLWYQLEALVRFFIPASLKSKDIHGEKALVTGAGSGIGRLTSIKLAERGCTLVLWDVNSSANEETAAECRKHGVNAFAYTVDLRKKEDVYKVADQVKADVGDIDILVNNAGIVTGKSLLECPDHLIQATMDINTTAHFWTLKAFLPAMLEKNHGHIVTVASMAGLAGTSELVDYCASKFGAVGIHASLSNELYTHGKTGIKTTVVCPCYINTGMFAGAKVKFDCQFEPVLKISGIEETTDLQAPLITKVVAIDRWQWLLPELEPDYAAGKIVNAILTNQVMLLMPRSLYFLLALQPMMPFKTQHLLGQIMGANSGMQNFIGRQSKND